MNELQIFNYNGNEVRTIQKDGEPWWVLKDVCAVFGETNYRRVSGRLDEDEKGVSQIDTPGGIQSMTVINESGLYSALFTMQPEKARGVTEEYVQNRQEQLKSFRRWVTGEVLPSIRKTGTYSVPQTTEGQIKLLAQGNLELSRKIDDVNKDLQDFKKEMPLLAIECQQITEAKNKRIVPLMGGKASVAYQNKSLRGRVYRDLEGQLRREFGVTSYKAIRRNQVDKAVDIIRNYELPMCLSEQVRFENLQMDLQ